VAVATAAWAVTVCCIWAAVSSAEGSSALSAKAVLMWAGRVRRKIALNKNITVGWYERPQLRVMGGDVAVAERRCV
jgi:hypothetical protein